MKIFTLILILVALIAVPTLALAQTPVENIQKGLTASAGRADIPTPAGNSTTNINVLVGRIINGLAALLGAIYLVVALTGGLLWMMAGGSEEKVNRAKGFIANGINGMIVIFFSYGLVYIILKGLDIGVSKAQ